MSNDPKTLPALTIPASLACLVPTSAARLFRAHPSQHGLQKRRPRRESNPGSHPISSTRTVSSLTTVYSGPRYHDYRDIQVNSRLSRLSRLSTFVQVCVCTASYDIKIPSNPGCPGLTRPPVTRGVQEGSSSKIQYVSPQPEQQGTLRKSHNWMTP